MATRDYYELLGISRNASAEDIKKAYKRLAKKYHPDVNKGDGKAEERFKEVSEAYHALSNPDTRKQYDLFGHSAQPGGTGFGGRAGGPGGSRTYTWSSAGPGGGVGFEEAFGRGGGLGDILNDLFTGRGRRAERRAGAGFRWEDPFGRDGAEGPGFGGPGGLDLQAEVTIGFEDAVRGGVHRLALDGPGGRRTVSVKIPPGVNDGGSLRIPGKGAEGPEGRSGDLLLRIHIKPHRFFRREGWDLHLDVPVTISEAALGAEITIPTLDGRSTLKVPAGSQEGTVLRMKDKGVAPPKGGKRGDMYVHLHIRIPKRLDPEAKRIFERLRQIETDPRKGRFV